MSAKVSLSSVKELPTLLGQNLQFLRDWANANEEQFTKVMEILAEKQPAKYADIYMKVMQQITPAKESKNSTTINVHHSLDTDMAKIHSLAGIVMTPSGALESPDKQTTYAEYEEIKANPNK